VLDLVQRVVVLANAIAGTLEQGPVAQHAPLPGALGELASQPGVVDVEPERHALLLTLQGERVDLAQLAFELRLVQQSARQLGGLHACES